MSTHESCKFLSHDDNTTYSKFAWILAWVFVWETWSTNKEAFQGKTVSLTLERLVLVLK
jgi:hypothetical protein